MSPDLPAPTRFSGHVYPQNIPVPDEIRPGRPAPWSHLRETQRSGLTLATVEARLRQRGRHFSSAPLPREAAELRVIVDDEERPITRASAVLVALYEAAGETRVILTRRSRELRNHRGEISFPGGRSDLGEDPVTTALREADEEVALRADQVEVIGWLSPLVTLASGSAIWPIVATLADEPTLHANPNEVEHVFSVSLRDLARDENFVEERWRRPTARPGADAEGFFPIYFFRTPADVIWGATARVVTELLCVALDVPWPEEDRFEGSRPE
ncbi:MAG: CoA pyrophosphatase [Acidobacteriota bacterium]|nr:CoA pyrophosphatase [Acidobacteriota bacterium]